MFRLILVFLFYFLGGLTASWAQANLLSEKTVGVYISSKAFSYPDDFYLPISQFLTLDDDRSWVGRMKAEFIIRMGWMFTEQLQQLAGADTIYFLNADLRMGRAFQRIYDPDQSTITRPTEDLAELDMVLVVNPYTLRSRMHRSVFIRSNRMITERITVKTSQFTITLFDLHNTSLVLPTQSCLDDQKGPNPNWHFDFYRNKSAMGKFLSKGFSQWWDQMLEGNRDNCTE